MAMRCPCCGNREVRIGECYELLYELDEGNVPGELLNGSEAARGPGDCYFVCTECWCRWDESGALLGPVHAVPPVAAIQ